MARLQVQQFLLALRHVICSTCIDQDVDNITGQLLKACDHKCQGILPYDEMSTSTTGRQVYLPVLCVHSRYSQTMATPTLITLLVSHLVSFYYLRFHNLVT